MDVRCHGRAADSEPVGMRQDRRGRVGEERERHQDEDPLGGSVGAAHDQKPDDDRSNRHRDVFRHMGERERRPDTHELADANAEVCKQDRDCRERRPADAVLLANQLGEPLAGDRAHPGCHLLDDDQRHSNHDHHPDQVVPVPGSHGCVGGDPAGVVARVRGDQARAKDSEEREETRRARATRPQLRMPGEDPVAQGTHGAMY